jgi:hypothetical protein
MSHKLSDPLAWIAFGIGIVLRSQKPVSISSENELLLQVENLILEHLPLVQHLRESLVANNGLIISSEAREMIQTFYTVRRYVFPFRIHLSDIEDKVLLDILRFALFVFSNENKNLITLFELHQKDVEDIYLLVNREILFSDKERDKYFLLKKKEVEEENALLLTQNAEPTCISLGKTEEKPKAKKVKKIAEKVVTMKEKEKNRQKQQINLLNFLNKKRK